MAANSLRPQIVRALAAHRERPLTTTEIYQHVAASGVAGFDPAAKRDRNLVNREFSDLSGRSSGTHSKPSPQLITRVGRGRYIFNELNRPMDLALVRGYLEPEEAYEKRPARRRVSGIHRGNVSDLLRDGALRGAAGHLPGLRFYQPHYMRFEADHIVARSDGGDNERRNVQLLCGYCNRVKGTQGDNGHRLKMP